MYLLIENSEIIKKSNNANEIYNKFLDMSNSFWLVEYKIGIVEKEIIKIKHSLEFLIEFC
jgi:hypothetical protein